MSSVQPGDGEYLGELASDAMTELLHGPNGMGPERFAIAWGTLRGLAVDAYLLGASSAALSVEDTHRIIAEIKDELGIQPGMATPTFHGISEAINLAVEKARTLTGQVTDRRIFTADSLETGTDTIEHEKQGEL